VKEILVGIVDKTIDKTTYPNAHALAVRFVSNNEVTIIQVGQVIRFDQ